MMTWQQGFWTLLGANFAFLGMFVVQTVRLHRPMDMLTSEDIGEPVSFLPSETTAMVVCGMFTTGQKCWVLHSDGTVTEQSP